MLPQFPAATESQQAQGSQRERRDTVQPARQTQQRSQSKQSISRAGVGILPAQHRMARARVLLPFLLTGIEPSGCCSLTRKETALLMGDSCPGTLSLAACTHQADTTGPGGLLGNGSHRVSKRRNTGIHLLSRPLITSGITSLGSGGKARAGGKGQRRPTCHTPWALVSGSSSPTCSALLKLGPGLQHPAHHLNQGPAKAAFLLSLLPFPFFSLLWSQPLQLCHSFLEVKH